MMDQTVVAQIAELERMPIDELRKKWKYLYGKTSPASSNRRQLVARLAYRIQELAYGGLSREARERLEKIAGMSVSGRKTHRRDPNLPVPGTKLIREWQGGRIEVTVLETGFECEGKRYRSLSAIAATITGTKWNGWEFFGLRPRKKSRKSASSGRAKAAEDTQ